MNILLTGVGGPTPRSLAYSLKNYSDRFRECRLVATDINPLAIGLYQNGLFERSYRIPRADDDDYWRSIHQIIEQEHIDLAFIQPELEVFEWGHYADVSPLPCPALIPEIKLIYELLDKSKMTELLRPTGLVPKSIAFGRDVDYRTIEDTFSGPFWVRSSSGTSGLGSLLVDTEDKLTNWIRMNPEITNFMASTYLRGRNLACKMLYYEGKLLRSACAERVNYIMAKVAPSGITGNTSFGRLLNEPELVERGKRALEIISAKLGCPLHGFFTVDFKEDRDGNALITEINVRHVAFTQCFAAGGANLAEDTIRLLTGDPDFDMNYKMYEFEPGLIFLRDVDALPIIMKEDELLTV